ncbi:RDD domain-containing protein [Myxococcus stipitatus DSM 14675]|uniref:RDD domain-containing protein n=1 Tax=Myxococcus stipitatus (strain DSM 14675 / JCM 12634 / Mx s8) TaxID=1278073 RepID=L7U8T4_MYXSD|nr:RDD family protein [Myxococcus stipitatus]AGC44503.1 RDD domain-containing protein [Myxococcus stipitatus DSM 14675]
MSAPRPDVRELSTEARCPLHPSASAVATCERCGNFACDQCVRRGPDLLSYCQSCLGRGPEFVTLASRGDRLLATLFDAFIISAPLFFAGVGQGLASARKTGFSPIWVSFALLITLGVLVAQLFGVARTGQSLGKRWRGIKVVRMDGSPVSLGVLLLVRNLIPHGVSQLTLGVTGILDTLFIFREDRRCLHDLIAGTQVVYASSDESSRHA